LWFFPAFLQFLDLRDERSLLLIHLILHHWLNFLQRTSISLSDVLVVANLLNHYAELLSYSSTAHRQTPLFHAFALKPTHHHFSDAVFGRHIAEFLD
jgi:hypothetical protein